MPFRHHLTRLFDGGRHDPYRAAREAKALARAAAQERLARHDTKPYPSSIDVLPADRRQP